MFYLLSSYTIHSSINLWTQCMVYVFQYILVIWTYFDLVPVSLRKCINLFFSFISCTYEVRALNVLKKSIKQEGNYIHAVKLHD